MRHARDLGPRPTLAQPCDLDLECPISVDLFEEPVICNDDGHTYEKDAIVSWVLSRPQPTSPMTRAVLKEAIAWKRDRTRAPLFYRPNVEMRARVSAYMAERETFAARVASWEEAQQHGNEDAEMLAVLELSRAEAASAGAPSAPPWELCLKRDSVHAVAVAVSHPWLSSEAAPFGRIEWPGSKQKQTASEYAKRGEIAWRTGDVLDALRWYGKAVQRAPEETSHVLRVAQLLQQEGRMREALMWLHHGVRTRPDDVERLHTFGVLLLAQQGFVPGIHLEDAGFYLQRALNIWTPHHDPQRPHSCMQLARLSAAVGDYRLRAGRIQEAHGLFELAEKNHGNHGPYIQRLGRTWLDKARLRGLADTNSPELQAALRYLEKARGMLEDERLDGRDRKGTSTRALAACLHSLGEARLWAGDDAAAVDKFREALKLDRYNGVYHGALADALRNMGDMVAARSSYFTAVERDPTCGRYEYELSCIAYAERNWNLALGTAEAAAKKAPENALYASQVVSVRALAAAGGA